MKTEAEIRETIKILKTKFYYQLKSEAAKSTANGAIYALLEVLEPNTAQIVQVVDFVETLNEL